MAAISGQRGWFLRVLRSQVLALKFAGIIRSGSSPSAFTGFAMGPTFPAHVAILMGACCVRQPMWVPHFTPTLSQMRWCSQSCVEALLIESPFVCHIFAFHSKKPGFLPRTPLLPPNEPCNFLCEMALYLEICHAYSGDGGGGGS